MFNDKLDDIVAMVEANYDAEEITFNDVDRHFPNKKAIEACVKELRRVIFPRYFGNEAPCGAGPKYFIGNTLTVVEETLHHEIREALWFRDPELSVKEADAKTSQICSDFFYRIPTLQELLLKDVQAAYDGDPAAPSKAEIIYCYPGFFAIFCYRLAHELYLHDVPLVPRIITEYAHRGTGVDINAGADIGEYFFIDHATGVVIGETAKVGSRVKIYQGVTLGALSLRKGQKLRGTKRHPTIEDNVTIYANASILGGETIIGKGSTIGGNAFVTQSVPPHSRVTLANLEVTVD